MPGKSAQGAFALQATQQLMPYFAQRFGQPYALPKLDQLAVPSTRFGAMEDWGLVSYTEGGLLFDPARDGVQRAIGIHTLIAHELAHQWFGNLVTAASWEEIWLNEAFATWLATEASNHFHPEWQLPLGRRAQLDRVLALDAGGATRAIRGDAVDEQQVFQVFDGITYAKGGAVLSMLQHWLGVPVFDRGLQAYMADRRLSNATAGDLWHHLGAAAGRDVRGVAASWTDQPGHPLLRVTQRCEGRGASARTALTIAQARFRMDDADGARADDTRWQVPVALARGDQQRVLLLTRAQQRFELPGCHPQRPWRANAGGLGFYRVLHDPAAHARLAETFAELPAVDRLTLLSDTQALVQTGQRPFTDWLVLAERVPALPPAQRPEALRAVLAGWQWFIGAADGGALGQALQARAVAMLSPELQRLGLAPAAEEAVADSTLRATLIGALARWGDEPLLEQALGVVRDDLSGRTPLPPATRQALYQAAGMAADEALHTTLLQAALQATAGAERSLLLEALAANRDPALAARTLALSLAPATPPAASAGPTLRDAEAFNLPQRVARASPHAALAYAHAVTHFEALMSLVDGAGWGERERLLPDLASRFATRAQADRLLLDQQQLAGAAGAINAQRAVQEIVLRARWREAQGEAVLKAL
jgi:aminopeptidase N